jgi:hypothetical protein
MSTLGLGFRNLRAVIVASEQGSFRKAAVVLGTSYEHLDWNDYHKQVLAGVGHIGRKNRNGIELAVAVLPHATN